MSLEISTFDSTWRYQPELSTELAAKFSSQLRNPQTMTELNVTSVGDIDVTHHIEFDTVRKIHIVVHPKFQFKISAKSIPIEAFSDIEDCAIALAKQLEKIGSKPEINFSGLAHSLVKTDEQKKLFATLLLKHQNDKDGQNKVEGILFRISSHLRVSFTAAPDDIAILLFLHPADLRKGFLMEHVNEAVRTLEKLL
jgi:hypothetical protein